MKIHRQIGWFTIAGIAGFGSAKDDGTPLDRGTPARL
jgi:hypothetical protein